MFKTFTSSNFLNDIKKHISRSAFSIELLLSEEDFLFLFDDINSSVDDKKIIEIIICSTSEDKSIRIFNSMKTLIDKGCIIYWNTDLDIQSSGSYFYISDKSIVINKVYYVSEDSEEDQVRYMNDIFNTISENSKLIELSKGNIEINLISNKTIVRRNEIVEINWEVKNADKIFMVPQIEGLLKKGSKKFRLLENTLFELSAENEDFEIKKNLFVRVLKNSKLEVNVRAYDPTIEEYILLEPTYLKKTENYACFQNQNIKISWDFKNDTKFSEKKLGDLGLVNNLEFKIDSTKEFLFELKSGVDVQKKKVSIIAMYDPEISKKLNTQDPKIASKKNSFNIFPILKNLLKKK